MLYRLWWVCMKNNIAACFFSKLGMKGLVSCLLFHCSYFLNILHNVSYLKRNSVIGTLVNKDLTGLYVIWPCGDVLPLPDNRDTMITN